MSYVRSRYSSGVLNKRSRPGYRTAVRHDDRCDAPAADRQRHHMCFGHTSVSNLSEKMTIGLA